MKREVAYYKERTSLFILSDSSTEIIFSTLPLNMLGVTSYSA